MSSPLPIIICGAGIGGLALGQGLYKANIPFKIVERDPTLNARLQGYRVRINHSGIAALKEVLPDDVFKQLQACSAIPASKPDEPYLQINALTGEKRNRIRLNGTRNL
jgi:2-polyprenyl-6-methoxyphenol hydroxylase-like FAD-dependent oxidoreductase